MPRVELTPVRSGTVCANAGAAVNRAQVVKSMIFFIMSSEGVITPNNSDPHGRFLCLNIAIEENASHLKYSKELL